MNHYCAFNDDYSCNEFLEKAREAGFAVSGTDYYADNDKPCIACSSIISAIELELVNNMTNKLCLIAQSYGGKYEYWDCKLVSK